MRPWIPSLVLHKTTCVGCMPVIPGLGMEAGGTVAQGQPGLHNEFKTSLGYMKSCPPPPQKNAMKKNYNMLFKKATGGLRVS